VKLGKPLVFEKTPFDDWALRQTIQQVDHLPKILGETVMVHESTDSNVLYHLRGTPIEVSKGSAWVPPTHKHRVPLQTLVDSLKQGQSKNGTYLYYTESAKHLGEEWGSRLPFVVEEEAGLNARGTFKPDFRVNFWAGSPNLSARIHYDTYHNFYLQAVGRKRFVLLPPTEWVSMHMYPALHPSARQSQLPLSEYRGLTEPLEVVLEPGQVLYLPPYWFHHVEAVDASISVNIWTDSRLQWLEYEIAYNALPRIGAHSWPEEYRRGLVFHIMQQVMGRLAPLQAVPSQLLDSQFLLLEASGLYELKDRPTDRGQGFCAFTELPMDEELTNVVHDHTKALTERFSELETPVREISFGNTFQSLIHWTQDEEPDIAKYVHHYLHCVVLTLP
jgi:hypothetical protein